MSACSRCAGQRHYYFEVRYLAPRKQTPPGVAFCFRNTDGKLGCKAVVVVQAIQDGDCYEPSPGRDRTGQRRIRIRYSVQTLVNSAVVVPGDELSKD